MLSTNLLASIKTGVWTQHHIETVQNLDADSFAELLVALKQEERPLPRDLQQSLRLTIYADLKETTSYRGIRYNGKLDLIFKKGLVDTLPVETLPNLVAATSPLIRLLHASTNFSTTPWEFNPTNVAAIPDSVLLNQQHVIENTYDQLIQRRVPDLTPEIATFFAQKCEQLLTRAAAYKITVASKAHKSKGR